MTCSPKKSVSQTRIQLQLLTSGLQSNFCCKKDVFENLKYSIYSDFIAALCNCMLQKDQFFPYSCVLIINQSVQFSSYILCSYFCLEHTSTVIIIQLQRENSPKSPLNQLGQVTLTLYKKIFEGKKISDFSMLPLKIINGLDCFHVGRYIVICQSIKLKFRKITRHLYPTNFSAIR